MSPRVRKTLLLVEPILLMPRRDPFDDPASLFEPKYDGFRGMLHVKPGGGAFTSKRGLPLKRFDQLAQEVRDQLRVSDAILDAELLAVDPEGRPNFLALMRGQGSLHYAAFDLLWVNGRTVGRSSRLRSDWTSRGSWRSGRPILMPRGSGGSRSRTGYTVRQKAVATSFIPAKATPVCFAA